MIDEMGASAETVDLRRQRAGHERQLLRPDLARHEDVFVAPVELHPDHGNAGPLPNERRTLDAPLIALSSGT